MDGFRKCFKVEPTRFTDGFEVGREEIERTMNSARLLAWATSSVILSGCSHRC